MTKQEQYKRLKLQLESLTGKKVQLVKEAKEIEDDKTYKLNAKGETILKEFLAFDKVMTDFYKIGKKFIGTLEIQEFLTHFGCNAFLVGAVTNNGKKKKGINGDEILEALDIYEEAFNVEAFFDEEK